MDPKAQFDEARARIDRLTAAPSTPDLLELYALYKQATIGDVSGPRPSALDFRARAKFDAWATKRGATTEAAMAAYVALAQRLGA